MSRLIFLGTGGGKNVTARQARRTGGIFLELNNKKIIIDPGPGTLVHANSLKLHPENWNIVLLSHIHPDHSTDVNIILDCIGNNKKKPVLITNRECIRGDRKEFPCVSKYHQDMSEIYEMKDGKSVKIDGMEITAVHAEHYSPTIGFVIRSEKTIGYTSDGPYYEGQEKNFENCDLIIFNVLGPMGTKIDKKKHMHVECAIKLLKKLKKKPKLAVITHFSFWMLKANVYRQAKIIEKETGVKIVAAEDFMTIDLDKMDVVKKSLAQF